MKRPADDVLLSRCEAFLTMSKALQQKESLEPRIALIASLYNRRKNGSDSDKEADGSVIHVNKVNPITQRLVASLYGRRPDIIVKPRAPQWEQNAQKAELYLNWEARTEDHARELTLTLTAASMFPYGVVKLGVGDKGRPNLTYTHPISFRADPTRESFEPERGRWCAFRYKRSLSAMRASGLYREEVLDELAAKQMKLNGSEWSEETTPIWLWEHYLFEQVEGKRALLIVVSTEEFDTLIRVDRFSHVAGLPCRVLQFLPSFDQHFPIGPVELWLDQQRELNALRSNQLIHSDRSQRKLLYKSGDFDESEIAKFESTEPLVAIETKGNPREAAAYIEQANLNADVYQAEERILRDIQESSAVGDMHLGGSPNIGSRSATEASIMESSLRLSSSLRQDTFERFLQSVYRGFLNLAQERLDEDIQVKVMDGQWLALGKDEIMCDADVDINVSSTMPSDRKTEWEQGVELVTTVFGNPVMAPLINPTKALLYLLSKRPDIKNAMDWLNPGVMNPAGMVPPGMPPGPPGMAPPGMPGMGPGMPPGMPPGAPPGPPMDLNALLNSLAMEGTAEGASPLSMAGMFRKAARG